MSLEILTLIVFVNLFATVALWRARRPAKLKKKFINSLLHSKQIAPKHERPKAISEKFPSLADEQDRVFFKDFADFADVVNWWCADEHVGSSWRLQELADTELKIGFRDSPDFGRRYNVFYNQVKLGSLEIMPLCNYGRENPLTRTQIELQWVRLLSFEAVAGFLWTIANHVVDPNPDSKEYLRASMTIQSAMMKVLWQIQQISELDDLEEYGDLELQLDGKPIWYFQRRNTEAFRQLKSATSP